MNEFQKKLDELEAKKVVKQEAKYYRKTYGTTRNAIPGGRTVP
jgi:hypothetical protein